MNQVFQEWFKNNAPGFGGQLLFDEPLARYTYYRIGGPASVLAIPKSLEDLNWLKAGMQATGVRYFILGAGSNLLVSDDGYPGLVIRLNRLNLELKADASQGLADVLRVRAGASVMISMLLRQAAQEGWGGLEFLAGVPGSVGGAVFMNAGTHLGESKDLLRRVEVIQLEAATQELMIFEKDDLTFDYRKNLFLPKGGLVWATEWDVRREDPVQVKAVIDGTLARRKATQPIDYPSCGSVFKNPRESGKSAWQVVDALGMRGYRIGDAQFSEKHSNFIVNLGKARSADVKALIEMAKTRAEKELGIRLQEEVIYLS
jgi:UDP-N-acetylmuramate dehydrogenase